jgi:uncharacterized membrane protein YhdT
MNNQGKNFGFWLFSFGLVFAFFHIMPAFLTKPFRGPLNWGDMLDFLTPFVFIFLSYFLYAGIKKSSEGQSFSSKSGSLFFKIPVAVGFILFVNGHGLHLSSNSISRFIENAGMKQSAIFKAVYLFDEIISHLMWDSGVFIISLGFIIGAARMSVICLNKTKMIFLFLGAVFYGFTFAVNGIEGQTVLLTFPAAVLGFFLSLGFFLKEKKEASVNQVHLFFLVSYFIAAVLFAYWGLSHSGFPEFSALGWI